MDLFISTTIPAWVIAIIMVYTGTIWLLCKARGIRTNTKPFAYTLILWGILYGVFQLFAIDIEVRGFVARTMLVLICFSQSVPLTISYIRSIRYARNNNSK